MIDLDKLKVDACGCPYCGSLNLRLSIKRKFIWPRWVMCSDCGADGPLVDSGADDAERAIAAWNERIILLPKEGIFFEEAKEITKKDWDKISSKHKKLSNK